MFFLQGIPEMTGLTALSLALSGVLPRWRLIIPVGVILAIIVYVIRLIFPFGLHTIIGLLLMVLFIAKTTTVPLTKSFIFVFAAGLILSLLELFFNEFLFAITGIDKQAVLSNQFIWKLFCLPQAIIMIFLALLVYRIRKPFQETWKI